MRVTDSILLSIDFELNGTENSDDTVLVVGRKKKGEVIDIVNAFQGEEAMKLYKKLTASEKKE